MTRPSLLVVSHVHPFPGSSGQQQRVRYKLDAFREQFHVTFLTFAKHSSVPVIKQKLEAYCDEAIVLSSNYHKNILKRIYHRLTGTLYSAFTGLKRFNYLVGKVELSAQRIASVLNPTAFDVVVYEYLHAVESTKVFQSVGVPCVLDMHDILWKSYERQLNSKNWLPDFWKRWALRQYQNHEHYAWETFDALIAISDGEKQHVQNLFPNKRVFYAPMGIDTSVWIYSYEPVSPPRIAYYGGLGNPYNQKEAMRCYEQIMPHIWSEHPDVEFWFIGSNPPDFIRALPYKDTRVHVPGFVEDIQSLLKTITLVLCPFEGQFGFRSRLIEVMALGVPVVATPNAVYGMRVEDGYGLLLSGSNENLANYCLRLIEQSVWAREQSHLARQQVEQKYSFDATYGVLTSSLYEFAED